MLVGGAFGQSWTRNVPGLCAVRLPDLAVVLSGDPAHGWPN
jgi:hypothetical protein